MQAMWLRPKVSDHPEYSTAYDHMKTAWLETRKEAVKERRNTGVFFHPDGQAANIRDGDDTFRTLPMQEITALAVVTGSDTERSVRESLPKGCEGLYDAFDYRQLKDNLADPQSVFLQETNATLIAPFQTAILESLLEPGEPRHGIVRRDGRIDYNAIHRFASREDAVLEGVLTHFNLTCGIPAREFQLKTLLYDSLREGTLKWRNLFILDYLPGLANPNAKKMTKMELGECLWQFTPMMARPFMFWMAIMRAVITRLLQLVEADISFRHTHIFVRAFPKTRKYDAHVMAGTDVNAIMQKLSPRLPVRLTCALLRLLFTTMFDQYLPNFLTQKTDNKEDAAVLGQGQHRELAGNTHYKRSENVPPVLNMTLAKARQHMKVSQVQQALLGMNQMAEGMDDEFLNSSLYQGRRYEHAAFTEARSLVVIHYGLGGQDSARKVQDILSRCPYIYGDQARPPLFSPDFLFTYSVKPAP